MLKSNNPPASIPPLLVVVGQSASGKSALAIDLAQRLNGEIICADSWTVRRELDIGTAKPTVEEQALIPHHLLDVVGPDQEFTAAVFKDIAQASIEDITTRGKLPIVVGGTGLYVDGLLYDFGFLPSGDRTLRKALDDLDNAALLQMLHKRHINIAGIDIRNKRRLIRALETDGERPTRQELRTNTLIIGLTIEPGELQKRIVARIDNMIAAGLEAEVRQLSERYGWNCEGLKGIGYREWKDYFSGTQTRSETRDKIIKSTKNLAKRQKTWFKRNKSIHWLVTPVNLTQVEDMVTTNLSK